MDNYQRGQKYLESGRYDEAAAAFIQSLEKIPDLSRAYIGLGDAYTHLNNNKAAEINARHALSQLNNRSTGNKDDALITKDIAYAHRVLGMALLNQALTAIKSNDFPGGSMLAKDAASQCDLAVTLNQTDNQARLCEHQARTLLVRS